MELSGDEIFTFDFIYRPSYILDSKGYIDLGERNGPIRVIARVEMLTISGWTCYMINNDPKIYINSTDYLANRSIVGMARKAHDHEIFLYEINNGPVIIGGENIDS